VKLANTLGRLLVELGGHAVFGSYAVMLVADYVALLQAFDSVADVKAELEQGVFGLLDLCSPADMARLFTAADVGSRQVFQQLHDKYKQHHQYKGAV
jgi:hypothetical protein